MVYFEGCYLTGIHPQNPETIEKIKSYAHNRGATEEEVQAALRRDSDYVIDLQRRLDFVFIDDGQYHQDLFERTRKSTTGMEEGSDARWFDNNTFFVRPKITERSLDFNGGLSTFSRANGHFKTPWKVNLPSPYTFADAAQLPSEYPKEEFLYDIARFLGEIAHTLFEGIDAVHLNEPALAYHQTRKRDNSEIKCAVEAINTLIQGAHNYNGKKNTVILHTYFGDFSNLCPEIFECKADVIGIDAIKTNFDKLSKDDFPKDKAYALGVVNSRSSIIESPGYIAGLAERAAKRIGARRVYIVPNCDLEFVTLKIAEEKMRNMAEGLRLLRGD